MLSPAVTLTARVGVDMYATIRSLIYPSPRSQLASSGLSIQVVGVTGGRSTNSTCMEHRVQIRSRLTGVAGALRPRVETWASLHLTRLMAQLGHVGRAFNLKVLE